MDYPYYWGHADETGAAEVAGATLNLPLPRGTDWNAYEPVLQKALERIGQHEPELLIVSYGADTYENDPISHFKLKTSDYASMARRIGSLRLPTVVIMEGGYAVEALGVNVAGFLGGF
jgi:acetoin utilization deacetylase AcuC-like enzyme